MQERKVVIAECATELDASIIISHLEAAGITATVIKDDAGGMLPSLQQTRGVLVLVAESDQRQAEEVLDELNDERTDDETPQAD